MITAIAVIFVIGFLMITLEHKTHIDKAATAVLLGMTLWVLYILCPDKTIVNAAPDAFKHFIETTPEVANSSLSQQCVKFVSSFQISNALGSAAQIVVYLIAAMTIVELIDVHGGFNCITSRIKTRNKTKLLVIVAVITFFLSSILDNLTTAIVMTMMMRKIVSDKNQMWIYSGIIIIAANSGGVWSPIGDVTTIMLWVNENVTTAYLVKHLFLPSLVSLLVPVVIVAVWLGRGDVIPADDNDNEVSNPYVTNMERNTILVLGVGGLLSIPVFKALTHLPPFMGALFALGVIWVYVGIMYDVKVYAPESKKYRITRVLQRIDFGTILFFLGILMAVSVLQAVGILGAIASFLDRELHDVYIINTAIGMLSSVVDNVPLVASAMGMYQMPTPEMLAASNDAAYLSQFVQNGTFWLLLTYCAGVGGSLLIIGSAAGVVVMGLEKITFSWYLKRFMPVAAAGYFSGIITFAIQSLFI